MDELSAHPKFKGVRHLVESEPADDWLVQPTVLHGLQRLAEYGLTYDLLVQPRHLRHAKTVAEKCPDLRLVIDHLAKPSIAKREFDEWSHEIEPLATFPQVYCKLSGLVTEAKWDSWTIDDLRPYVYRAIELFGPRHLIFGSDHPVCLLAASYERVLQSFQEMIGKDEHDLVFGENARIFYRLNK